MSYPSPSSYKIIIIGPAHPLRPGGITTFNERLCKAFGEAGHECSIWSFSLQYPSFLFPGSSQFTDAPAPAHIKIVTAINSVNPLNWIRVGRRISKEKPDIVVVRYWIPLMGPCLGTILRCIRKNKHTKIVCIADNIKPHESRPGDSLFTRYFVKPMDRFIVMSAQVLQDLKTFTQTSATLLPHPLYDNFGEGVDTATARQALQQKFALQIAPDKKLLLFFGLIRQYKGLDLLLEAMQYVQDPNVLLLIGGEYYDDPQKYEALLQHPALAGRVLLHAKFIDNDDVKYFVCASDCVVQPYRSATQSGVTPVAYHFEIPMIVTNVGGLPEMVPHQKAGIVCEPTAASIAQAVDQYFAMGKPSFMTGLLEEKQKLSWQKLVSNIIE
ncbi:MAG TPA: glycosyltransferase [Phnomibacter sp.]|nr:glycosyltransferase [Phnomibacter sp.]